MFSRNTGNDIETAVSRIKRELTAKGDREIQADELVNG